MLELKRAQTLMLKLYGERDKKHGVEGTFIWQVEEVGELSQVLWKKNDANIREELVDLLAWLLSFVNVIGVDVSDSFRVKYNSVCPCFQRALCNCGK
jgi:NTP pyrophosphatase (non-canonical NTP hydrolase)